jgi:hypothetical protein
MHEPPPIHAIAQRPPVGARCAVHAETEALAVCVRCGNYMCAACSQSGRSGQCNACVERAGGTRFPFSRDRWRFSAVVEYCWTRFKAEWLTLSLGALIFLALIYGLAMVGVVASVAFMRTAAETADADHGLPTLGIRIAVQALQVLAQLWLQLGLFALALDTLEGRSPRLSTLFTRIDRFPAALLQLLIIYAALLVFLVPVGLTYVLVPDETGTRELAMLGVAVVLAIPAFYLAIGCGFGMLELVHNPSASAVEALRTSFCLVHGHRLIVVGTGLFAAVVVIAGAIACCVGIVPALALGTLIIGGVFLALKTPTSSSSAPSLPA